MEKFLSMPEPTADGSYSGKVEILLPVQKREGK